MKLVKRTVNFDDPVTYHFYYGDATGTPGSLITFFPRPTAPVGSAGVGQISGVSLQAPRQLAESLEDPSGLRLDLTHGADFRIRSVTLTIANGEKTARFLTEVLGFRGEGAHVFLNDTEVHLIERPELPRAKLSSGMIHHVAFRVADEPSQNEWRARLKQAGVRATRVIDRQYFKSIYFREPGGVLFEIATDGPGFLIDEAADLLGDALKLPPWLEPLRESIERRLPEVR
jgi:glyoxalase family protein